MKKCFQNQFMTIFLLIRIKIIYVNIEMLKGDLCCNARIVF